MLYTSTTFYSFNWVFPIFYLIFPFSLQYSVLGKPLPAPSDSISFMLSANPTAICKKLTKSHRPVWNVFELLVAYCMSILQSAPTKRKANESDSSFDALDCVKKFHQNDEEDETMDGTNSGKILNFTVGQCVTVKEDQSIAHRTEFASSGPPLKIVSPCERKGSQLVDFVRYVCRRCDKFWSYDSFTLWWAVISNPQHSPLKNTTFHTGIPVDPMMENVFVGVSGLEFLCAKQILCRNDLASSWMTRRLHPQYRGSPAIMEVDFLG